MDGWDVGNFLTKIKKPLVESCNLVYIYNNEFININIFTFLFRMSRGNFPNESRIKTAFSRDRAAVMENE